MSKNTENVINNSENQSNVHKSLNLDNSVKKKEIQKIFYFMYATLDGLSKDTTDVVSLFIPLR